MPMCERCWALAYWREMGDTSKSQAEHYAEICREQDALGKEAQCPTVRRFWREAPDA